MACRGETFLNCKLAQDCACYRAVMRTYQSMAGDAGIPDRFAVEAARRVYQFHRPFDAADQASTVVERWVCQDRLQ